MIRKCIRPHSLNSTVYMGMFAHKNDNFSLCSRYASTLSVPVLIHHNLFVLVSRTTHISKRTLRSSFELAIWTYVRSFGNHLEARSCVDWWKICRVVETRVGWKYLSWWNTLIPTRARQTIRYLVDNGNAHATFKVLASSLQQHLIRKWVPCNL